MRLFARILLVLVAAIGVAVPAATAGAQAPATNKAARPQSATPAPAPKTAPPAQRAPTPNDVLATVNGAPITRGEVVDMMSKYQPPPPAAQQDFYNSIVNTLVNIKLLSQFLDKQKVKVGKQEVDAQVAAMEKDLKARGGTLAGFLAETGQSMDQLRKSFEERSRWRNYVLSQATDAALKKFVDENKDALNGAQVRASHILLMVDPDAPAAEKEKVKQKLLGIKKDIESGRITFAEAADKYSEDPANVQNKVGGDLGWFPRRGQFIESFSDAAFQLKKGKVSDVVETPFGYHLIMVTDRTEGRPIDLAQDKEQILNDFAADLQHKVLTDARKTAKIDLKPMPADLFQPPPGATPAPAPPATKAAPKAAR
jgi:peptidyl-prolyl cis-trans isomerase C